MPPVSFRRRLKVNRYLERNSVGLLFGATRLGFSDSPYADTSACFHVDGHKNFKLYQLIFYLLFILNISGRDVE